MYQLKYPTLNPYILKNDNQYDQYSITCQLCNRGFFKNQATPVLTSCGHRFCHERCQIILKRLKSCPICQAPMKAQQITRQVRETPIRYNPNGGNAFNISLFHPQTSIAYKQFSVSGKVLLKDFIGKCNPILNYLSKVKNGEDFIMIMIQKTSKPYKQVKNKNLDALAIDFNLISCLNQPYAMNVILFKEREKGGSILQMQFI